MLRNIKFLRPFVNNLLNLWGNGNLSEFLATTLKIYTIFENSIKLVG